MRRLSFLFAATALLLAACGSSDSDGAASTTTRAAATTTSSSAPAETTSTTGAPASTTTAAPTTSEAPDPSASPACTAYTTILDLYASLEPIATGSNEAQVAAQSKWDAAIAELAAAENVDASNQAAVDTLSKLRFTVTEDATGVPTEGELIEAFDVLDLAYAAECGLPTECPPPETLEAEGLTCDGEGNLTPIPGNAGGQVEECPAPEVLEAEGFSCDSEGNLTPIG